MVKFSFAHLPLVYSPEGPESEADAKIYLLATVQMLRYGSLSLTGGQCHVKEKTLSLAQANLVPIQLFYRPTSTCHVIMLYLL
jgi:hypothetical protein